MTRDDVRAELVRLLAEAVEGDVDASRISDDASLRDDIGITSLDAVVLVLDLEDAFGIEVADDELLALDTVASLVALVEAKASAVGGRRP